MIERDGAGRSLVVISLPRRALARFAEFATFGEILDSLDVLPRFHETIFGENLLGELMLFFAASMVFDLLEFVSSYEPERATMPCGTNEPELPLEG